MKTHSVYLALSVLILLATVCCKASNAPNIEQEQRIKEFVDRFKNAYYRKDIKTLNAIWGDNMREKALSKEKPKMQMQTKSAYLSKMKYIFRRNEQLNIVFDSIEIVQHPDPRLENIYGVTMKQYWNTAEYYDVGYVFLLLNCSRKKQIEILVSAWQPEEELKSHSDIFGLSHFIIELNK